jgi:competence ComEA-like helix-hairpin-helix protein
MGFSNDFISTWFSRKNEIGFITSTDQLLETGLLSKSEFETVAPYLDFSRYKKEVTKPAKKPLVVYINQADAEGFKQLKGIGEVLSKRIVTYREKLGGFIQIEQLGEVYGLHDSVLLLLKDQLKLVNDHQTINLNAADAKMLYHHPYIDYKRAKAIVRYRDQHGPFQRLEDVLDIVLIDSAWLNHARAYLSL